MFLRALRFLTVLLVLFVITGAQAQTPSKPKTDNAEEAAVFERILNRAHFENDGTGVEETEAVIRIQNQLADQGISLITEAPDGPIHASGHPRRGELTSCLLYTSPSPRD